MRTAADFDNFRKRARRELESVIADQVRAAVTAFDSAREFVLGDGIARFLFGQQLFDDWVDLAQRLIFLMVNEAARCLEEIVVESPEDADYGMILGTGFAPFRGGPLRFADHFGLKKIVDEMERLAQSDDKVAPCALLKKHARDGTTFYEDAARSA